MRTCVFLFFVYSQFIIAKTGEITVSSAVEISPRMQISAYDIVETKNVSPALLESLKNIVIADSKTEKILQSEFAKKIRQIDARFIIPREIKLIKSTQSISRMELERKIKNKILSVSSNNCETCDFKISISSVPKNIDSSWDLDLNIDLNKKSLMIPIFSTSPAMQKGWVTIELKKYQNIFVSKQDIKSNESITEQMVTKEVREVSSIRSIITSMQELSGKQTNRYISSGQILNAQDFKKELVLKKGQIVKAIYDNTQIQVSLSAVAEESGMIGDIIRFKNLDSQKIFSAKVLEKGLVQIE